MDWIDHCPLRSEDSPEYRLLLATIREEISQAMEKNNGNARAVLYSRLNLIILAAAIVGEMLIKWH